MVHLIKLDSRTTRNQAQGGQQANQAQLGNTGSWNRAQPGRQQRSASDTDFDWRKSGSGEQSPNNNDDQYQARGPGGTINGASFAWNAKKDSKASNWGQQRKMDEPEWLNTPNTESGVFDHTGNFSEGILFYLGLNICFK